jgi:hypothetical protein
MGKGNKPQKNDKASKKPKKLGKVKSQPSAKFAFDKDKDAM